MHGHTGRCRPLGWFAHYTLSTQEYERIRQKLKVHRSNVHMHADYVSLEGNMRVYGLRNHSINGVAHATAHASRTTRGKRNVSAELGKDLGTSRWCNHTPPPDSMHVMWPNTCEPCSHGPNARVATNRSLRDICVTSCRSPRNGTRDREAMLLVEPQPCTCVIHPSWAASRGGTGGKKPKAKH